MAAGGGTYLPHFLGLLCKHALSFGISEWRVAASIGGGWWCEGGLVIYLVDAFVAVRLRRARAGRRDEEVVGREAEHW